MGFAKVCIYDYFAHICKYYQGLRCCDSKTQYFQCVQIICIFYKSVCTKITIFFHFFRSIASCDHQLTSEAPAPASFSLLFAILRFSYDFDNVIFCKFIYFDNYILFCTHFIFWSCFSSLAFPRDFFSTPRTVAIPFGKLSDHLNAESKLFIHCRVEGW